MRGWNAPACHQVDCVRRAADGPNDIDADWPAEGHTPLPQPSVARQLVAEWDCAEECQDCSRMAYQPATSTALISMTPRRGVGVCRRQVGPWNMRSTGPRHAGDWKRSPLCRGAPATIHTPRLTRYIAHHRRAFRLCGVSLLCAARQSVPGFDLSQKSTRGYVLTERAQLVPQQHDLGFQSRLRLERRNQGLEEQDQELDHCLSNQTPSTNLNAP